MMKVKLENDFGANGVGVVEDGSFRVLRVEEHVPGEGNYQAGDLLAAIGMLPFRIKRDNAGEVTELAYDWCHRRIRSNCDEQCGGSLCQHRGCAIYASPLETLVETK